MSYLFCSVSLRRRWARMLASLTLPVLLVAFGPVQAEPQKLRIGTGDWAPYVDQERSDGGALARLISAVFAEAGYQVEFIFHPWGPQRTDAAAGAVARDHAL